MLGKLIRSGSHQLCVQKICSVVVAKVNSWDAALLKAGEKEVVGDKGWPQALPEDYISPMEEFEVYVQQSCGAKAIRLPDDQIWVVD